MTFIVTGLSLTGPVLIGCASEVGALEKAAALIRAGLPKALIADGQGVQYTPCEFVCRPSSIGLW